MAKTTTTRLAQTRWSSGTDTVRRLDFDTDAANLESLVAIYGQGLLSARPAANKSGRFYAVTGEGDPKLNGRIFYDNGTSWSGPRLLNDGYAESTAVGNTALTAKGFTGQTADIFKVTNSSETSPFMRVTNTGVVSNQSSIGVSGGYYFGFDSTHDASASFISLAANKPVLTLKAATSQTANLITASNSSSATIFSVSAAGDGVFAGSLASASLGVTGSATVGTLTANTAATTKNLFSSPVNANGVAATFASFSSHLNNIVAIVDSVGNRLARISADGTFATNARIVAGGGNGDIPDPSYASTTASLWVQNSYPNAPVARFVGNPAQSGNLLELASGSSGNPTLVSVDNTGNTIISTTLNVQQSVLVGAAGSPLTFFNTYQPKFSVNTGSSAGTYAEAIVIRHPQQDSTVVSRSLGLYMKISDESSQLESNKWAGITADSALANAASPNLSFWAGGSKAGWFDGSTLGLVVSNDLTISNGVLKTALNKQHWNLNGSGSIGTGLQANTWYFRGPSNFAWFHAGAYSESQLDPGVGGTLLMNLTRSGSDIRLTVPRITLTTPQPYNSPTPTLSIGSQGENHMQFSANTIVNYANDNVPGPASGLMTIQPGGTLNLGDTFTDVTLRSRVLFTGSNVAYFGGGNWGEWGYGDSGKTLRAPIDNDWWFDGTTETIKVRHGSSWKIVAA